MCLRHSYIAQTTIWILSNGNKLYRIRGLPVPKHAFEIQSDNDILTGHM